MHVSDQTLQALRDGSGVARAAYAHVDGCVRCRKALGAALPPPAPRTHVDRRIVALASVAAIAILLVAVAPIRAVAFGFVEIFEPHQIAFVPMTASDLSSMGSMPDFSDFGTGSEIRHGETREIANVRTAEAAAGYHVRVPLDAADYPQTRVTLNSAALEQFVFDESKARAAAATKHVVWQPMPAGMDGSVVRIAFGPTVVTRYAKTAETNGSFWVTVGGRRRHGMHTIPSSDGIVIAQMPVPKVGSTGISMAAIEHYMIDQPGVSPKLAAAFAALRDPSTTLLLPLPIDRRYAKPVFVDGVWGTGIGDDTGLGGGIVWERDGFVYAVGGMRTEHDLLAIANTLR